MYCLNLILRNRDEPPTQEEKDIVAGKKTIDPAHAAEYLVKRKKASMSICESF